VWREEEGENERVIVLYACEVFEVCGGFVRHRVVEGEEGMGAHECQFNRCHFFYFYFFFFI
jgi:hypothetical protein